MVSTRQIYYDKRVKIIKEIIQVLIDMLMLNQKDLMNYSYVDFKKLRKLFFSDSRKTIIFQKPFPKPDKK